MSILLPIISNTIIALILVLGTLLGLKLGWKRQLIRNGIAVGAATGLYFLAPILTGALLSIEAIAKLVISNSLLIVLSTHIVYLLSFFLVYIIAIVIEQIIVHCLKNKKAKQENNGKNIAKKSKNLSKREKKLLKQKAKQARKQYNQSHKKSRIIGAILGCVNALAFILLLMLPVSVINIEDCPIYDTTIIGVVDNAITGEKTVAQIISEPLLASSFTNAIKSISDEQLTNEEISIIAKEFVEQFYMR